MKRVAVLGAAGFVGSHVVQALQARGVTVIPVLRGDDADAKISQADIVIHSANSPRRYKATQDPKMDFIESVEKTYTFLQLAKKHHAKFVLISSISARTRLEQPYGSNRRACECLALLEGAQVIRLGYMFSHTKTYGSLDDILHNRSVYASASSRYSYADVSWIAKKIVEAALDGAADPLIELGSSDSITLGEVAALLKSQCTFVRDYADVQVTENPPKDAPPIEDFIKYLEKIK